MKILLLLLFHQNYTNFISRKSGPNCIHKVERGTVKERNSSTVPHAYVVAEAVRSARGRVGIIELSKIRISVDDIRGQSHHLGGCNFQDLIRFPTLQQ